MIGNDYLTAPSESGNSWFGAIGDFFSDTFDDVVETGKSVFKEVAPVWAENLISTQSKNPVQASTINTSASNFTPRTTEVSPAVFDRTTAINFDAATIALATAGVALVFLLVKK